LARLRVYRARRISSRRKGIASCREIFHAVFLVRSRANVSPV
jgi:hypothetical protein